MIILHTPHILFLHFETPCVVCACQIQMRLVCVCYKFFGCLFLMIFVVSSMFLNSIIIFKLVRIRYFCE